ncbi:IclR family transcriptional regulator [Nocardia aobensis]|uniref:IclR family transcriptional regulator n=1 Tax=Nocardia aobensis TaxID=257277 RepID=A0ABW6P9F6_9NOCA
MRTDRKGLKVASPPVMRVMRVLDYLALHPDEEFTISDLARRVGLNKATCHTIVTTLVEQEYLTRGAVSGRIQLGPALIPLGLVAEQRFRPLDVARTELHALAEDLGVPVVVSIRTGSEILHLAHYGPASVFSAMSRAGQRIPLLPPVGATFYAWSTDEVIDAWLDSLPHSSEQARQIFRKALAQARSLGYVAGGDSPLWRDLASTVREIESSDASHSRRWVEERIRDADLASYMGDPGENQGSAGFVSAPVFDSAGEVELTVTVHLGDSATIDVDDVVRRLTNLTAHMTVASGGRAPTL